MSGGVGRVADEEQEVMTNRGSTVALVDVVWTGGSREGTPEMMGRR